MATTILSATDLAIAAAIRAGTLRAEHARSPRLGNDYVAISDAVGLIEVALSGEEAARRIREVAEAAGMNDGHAHAGQAFARGVQKGSGSTAPARAMLGATCEALHDAAEKARIAYDNPPALRSAYLDATRLVVAAAERAVTLARAAEVAAAGARPASAPVALRLSDVLEEGSPLGGIEIRTIDVSDPTHPVEEFRGALAELLGENGDDAELDEVAKAVATDGISREIGGGAEPRLRIELVPTVCGKHLRRGRAAGTCAAETCDRRAGHSGACSRD